jgi:hypothetical protein
MVLDSLLLNISNVSDTTQVWYRDDQLIKTLWFEVNTEVVSLKAYSKSSQMGKKGHNICTLLYLLRLFTFYSSSYTSLSRLQLLL